MVEGGDEGSESGYGGCFLLIWVLTYPIGAFGSVVLALVGTREQPFRGGRREGNEALRILMQQINEGPIHEAVPWLAMVALVGFALAFALVFDPIIRVTGRMLDRASSIPVPWVGGSIYLLAWLVTASAGVWFPFALMILILKATPL